MYLYFTSCCCWSMTRLLTKTRVHTVWYWCAEMLIRYIVCTPNFVRTCSGYDVVCAYASVHGCWVRECKFEACACWFGVFSPFLSMMGVGACVFENVRHVGVTRLPVCHSWLENANQNPNPKPQSSFSSLALCAGTPYRDRPRLPQVGAAQNRYVQQYAMCLLCCVVSFSGLVRCRALKQCACFWSLSVYPRQPLTLRILTINRLHWRRRYVQSFRKYSEYSAQHSASADRLQQLLKSRGAPTTQYNAPSEFRHIRCVYGYSRPTRRRMQLKHSQLFLQTQNYRKRTHTPART